MNPPVRSADAFRNGTLQRGAATGAGGTKGEFQAGCTQSVVGGSVGLLSSDVNPNASPQVKVEDEPGGGCDLSPITTANKELQEEEERSGMTTMSDAVCHGGPSSSTRKKEKEALPQEDCARCGFRLWLCGNCGAGAEELTAETKKKMEWSELMSAETVTSPRLSDMTISD